MRYFSPFGYNSRDEKNLKNRFGKWSQEGVNNILDNIEMYLKWEVDENNIKFMKDYKNRFTKYRTKLTMNRNQEQAAFKLGLFVKHEKPINDLKEYLKFTSRSAR